MARSTRPIGSTHTGQPGPWIMLHVGAAAGRPRRSGRWRACGRRRTPSGGSCASGSASRGDAPRPGCAPASPSRNSSMYFMRSACVRADRGVERLGSSANSASVRCGLVRVELAQRVADVHDHVVADLPRRPPAPARSPCDAAQVDDRLVVAAQLDHARRNGQTHVSVSLVACRRSATQAWPSAMPPSLGGAWRASQHSAGPAASQPRHQHVRQHRVEEAAAAQRHGAQRRSVARPAAPSAPGRRPARGGTARRRAPASSASASRASSGTQVERAVGTDAPARSGRRRRDRRGAAGQRFQQHRRLAFVGRDLAHAQQAGGGIEAAAQLLVGGQRRPLASICAPRPPQPAATRSARSISPPRPSACSAAAAMRQGSRAARVAAGQRAAAPGDPGARSARRRRAAVRRPRPRRRCPARRRPAPGRAAGHRSPCSASDRGDVGVVVLHRDRRQRQRAAAKSQREAGAEEIGVQVVRHRLRAARRAPRTGGRAISTSASQVAALSRSPMCGETKASSPRVRHTVFLSQRAGGQHRWARRAAAGSARGV